MRNAFIRIQNVFIHFIKILKCHKLLKSLSRKFISATNYNQKPCFLNFTVSVIDNGEHFCG
jgi:hypothetical protein